MAETIRLNKALRELNVSIESAVDFLESKSIEIEKRPTTKISEEIYQILFDEFGKKDNIISASNKNEIQDSIERRRKRLHGIFNDSKKTSQELLQVFIKGTDLEKTNENISTSKSPLKVGRIDLEVNELDDFRKWLIKNEFKAESTVNSYASAIQKISAHYSKFIGKQTEIHKIKSIQELENILKHYDADGEFFEIGDIGNKTYINAIRALIRFKSNTPKTTATISSRKIKNKPKAVKLDKVFQSNIDDDLRNEAALMSIYYESFYCLEKSIRILIENVMSEKYGKFWWEKINPEIKEKVERNLEYELGYSHTKRSNNEIDYTTFGDLRKIIRADWKIFKSKFKRNLNSVDEVLIALNRSRGPIAHCTPFVDKEINRFEICIDDWFDLIKSP